jgi:hypothetical protein
MDKAKPSDWLSIKPGSVITVSDAQAIQDSMRRKLGVKGIDYTVKSVACMDHLDSLSKHIFLALDDPEQSTYLMVKMVDELVDLYLYFDAPGLEGGTRQQLLDRGMLWLFQEPSDPNNFKPEELRYSLDVRQTVDADGKQENVVYNLKGQGELQCDYTLTPQPSGLSKEMLATIVEYRSQQPVENPEFLILETGERRGNRSFVQFYLGCPIKLSEVDVLEI